MKTFSMLREAANKSANIVFSAKINKVPVKIIKDGPTSFVVYIDGDKLDTYRSQKTGETMAKRMIKQLKVRK
jgi:hypothetical protein